MKIEKNFVFTIFGASGSLARLKVLPAIYKIFKYSCCDYKYAVIGYSRTKMTDAEFREEFRNAVHDHVDKELIDDTLIDEICKNIYYISGQYDQVKDFKRLNTKIQSIEEKHFKRKKKEEVHRLFYLSIPPVIFKDVVGSIDQAGIKDSKNPLTKVRLVIEKPFGRDLKSAQELDGFLREHFQEEQIYRIDHYLGKEAVQNMLIFRFTNMIMEPLFNSRYISNVQITASESIGIEERAGYFDDTGILRDMIQPHVMQILSLIAMCRPYNFSADAIKSEKLKLLKSIRLVDMKKIDDYVVRGQYGSGTVDGKKVKAYLDEKNVKKRSNTESYVALKFFIDSHRWFGVPFFLRSGKRLKKKLTEINIEFKKMPAMATESKSSPIPSNLLTIRLQPDEGIFINITTKKSGTGLDIDSSQFTFYQSCEGECLDAYSRLIVDAINSNNELFIRFDEIEAAWKLVDPIIEHFEKKKKPKLHTYKAGSVGPKAADKLVQSEGYKWINH